MLTLAPISPIQPQQGLQGYAERLKQKKRDSSQQEAVQELKKTDQHVRSHEQAHMAAAGGYASGGPSFEYVTGPDGNRYAVAGEVKIDVSPVPGDPEKTLEKAKTIQAAASAPADPSSQDRAVAARAAQMEAAARQQIQMGYQDTSGIESGMLFNLFG